ncbi:hypothetical protein SSCG_05085 [Streptomyces clavuligerus]|nr:hypothetical protein SSCG_05085 [Streptomyces clavuligerus]
MIMTLRRWAALLTVAALACAGALQPLTATARPRLDPAVRQRPGRRRGARGGPRVRRQPSPDQPSHRP